MGVGEVGRLRLQRADLHVGLLEDQLFLEEALSLHQVGIAAQLALKLLRRRRREQTQQLEHLSVLVGELLDRGEVLELREVNHVDSLDGQDDAAARIRLSLSETRVRLLEKLEVRVQHLEGTGTVALLVKAAAHNEEEGLALIGREGPLGGVLHHAERPLNHDVHAALSLAEADKLHERKGLQTRVRMDAVKELHEPRTLTQARGQRMAHLGWYVARQ